jgi:hypothetical protein
MLLAFSSFCSIPDLIFTTTFAPWKEEEKITQGQKSPMHFRNTWFATIPVT